MARGLRDILTELDSVYNPQRQLYKDQRAQLDPMQDAELNSLDAAKQDSFNQIETGANRKGLYYSGIPIQEQAQYTGTNYLPSVANLKAKYAQQRFNIQDALAKITQDQYSKAYGIRESELSREEAARAARAASGGLGLGVPDAGGQTGVLGLNTDDFSGFIKGQFKSNPYPSRRQQQIWARSYALSRGLDPASVLANFEVLFPSSKYASIRPSHNIATRALTTANINAAQSRQPKSSKKSTKQASGPIPGLNSKSPYSRGVKGGGLRF